MEDRARHLFAIVAVAAAIAGCSSEPPPVALPPGSAIPEGMGPNNGTLFPLPDSKGYVEVVPDAGDGGRGKRSGLALKAFFLAPDKTNPLSPAPTAASIALKTAKGSTTVPLKAAGDAGEFSGESTTAVERIVGDLSATISGSEVKVPISIR